jgi:hypothetical protein
VGGERWYGEERDAVDGERVGADGDVYAGDEQGVYCDREGDGRLDFVGLMYSYIVLINGFDLKKNSIRQRHIYTPFHFISIRR